MTQVTLVYKIPYRLVYNIPYRCARAWLSARASKGILHTTYRRAPRLACCLLSECVARAKVSCIQKSPLPPFSITNNCYVVQHLLIVYNILIMLFNLTIL